MMIVTTLPDHFAVELIGGDRYYRPLKVIQRKLEDPNLYFGQFNYSSEKSLGFRFGDSPNVRIDNIPLLNFEHVAVLSEGARAEIDRRFPKVLRQYPTNFILAGDDLTTALTFAGRGRVAVSDSLLANTYEGVSRIRHVQLALIIPKRSPAGDYRSYLDKLLRSTEESGKLTGARMITAGKAEAVFKASQFANIYLMDGLHETSIGSFIDQHREILLSVLKGVQLISEPHLPWLVPSDDPKEDKPINPDLFVQRPDGYWDICELKLPLLDKKDVTTGPRSRRAFLSVIEKGVSQLVHYQEFLSIPEHAAFAFKKYGVKFNSPKCTLIFGNHENIDISKFREARRRFPGVEMIDYDSILQLYLVEKNALK